MTTRTREKRRRRKALARRRRERVRRLYRRMEREVFAMLPSGSTMVGTMFGIPATGDLLGARAASLLLTPEALASARLSRRERASIGKASAAADREVGHAHEGEGP